MTSSFSRRSFLAGVGGGLASAALAWGLWKYNLFPRGVPDAYPVPECCSYVDYGGWMLTKGDKERLLAQDSLKLLDASRVDESGSVAGNQRHLGTCRGRVERERLSEPSDPLVVRPRERIRNNG